MRIEEQYPDGLRDLEFAVASTCRECPERTDDAALRAYEADRLCAALAAAAG